MLFVGTSIIHPSTEGVFLLCNILDLLIYSFIFILTIFSKKKVVNIKLLLPHFQLDIRNQFICENAEILFNDYSREAEQVFQTLCQKYGKENGFLYLKEHPEYIRLGIKAMQ